MKILSELENRILSVLIAHNEIPNAPFDIMESHLVAYMHGYVEVTKKKPYNLDTSNYRYARKLAGLTLVKHNLKCGANISNIKAGFVYMIENPAFNGFYKIGMTVDTEARLSQYQTYDPYRAFKIKHYEFVLDRRAVERQILCSYHLELANGEWVKTKKAEKVFRDITLSYSKIYAP